MARLRIREFVEEHAPKLTMTELGRKANISNDTIRKVWKDPGNLSVELRTLVIIAAALSEYLERKVRVTDLIEDEESKEIEPGGDA